MTIGRLVTNLIAPAFSRVPGNLHQPSGTLSNMLVRRGLCKVAFTLLTITLVACGQQQSPELLAAQPQQQATQPLQSPIQPPGNVTVQAATQQIVPTVAPPTIAPTTALTAKPQLVPTVVRTPFALANGTPDTRATSLSVILTITALAQQPTRKPVPTGTPPRAIGAGGKTRVTRVPTPTLDPSGVTLLSLSNKVYRGGAMTLSIRTKPSAQCAVRATRLQADGTTTDLVIPDSVRAAGSDGAVAWIWPIGADVPAGQMTVRADCGAAGSAQYTVEIVK